MRRKRIVWLYVLLGGLLICGLVVVGIFWHQYQTQRLVKRVHNDFLLLAHALEAAFVDCGQYPPDELGLQFLVQPVRIGMATGVPKSYLPNNAAQLPTDPFHNRGRGMYGYAGGHLEGKPFGEEPNYNTWILTSYGPDRDRDIDPRLVRDQRYFKQNRLSSGLLYGNQALEQFAYDPTNGLISNGDMYRPKQ